MRGDVELDNVGVEETKRERERKEKRGKMGVGWGTVRAPRDDKRKSSKRNEKNPTDNDKESLVHLQFVALFNSNIPSSVLMRVGRH